ncbi:MAG TPA: phosphotransferase family protein [Acidimicrobiales bacterium]
MATGGFREDDALRDGLSRWLVSQAELVPGSRGGDQTLRITSLSHATAGLANETLLVGLGPDHDGIVVRLPPMEPTFAVYDLSIQARVQNAVAEAGIPAPAPAVAVHDLQWLGAPFLVMPRVEGYIPGPAPLFDEQITGGSVDEQRRLPDGLIDTLAALHAVDWSVGDLQSVLVGPTVDEALEFWTGYVEWAGNGDPLPALGRALDWCRGNRPAASTAAPSLLWGDARLGNLVFDRSRRVHAVLDWDLAAIGPPEMDLGWYFGLDFMMERLFGDRVPGFPSKSEAVARYEERSGRTVSDLDFHEVFALVRALAINDRHQRIATRARRARGDDRPARPPRENPMAQILLERLGAVE